MDWVLALAAVGACVWLASLALGTEADEAVELVKQGVGLRLWANCTACGGSTDLAVEWGDEPVWLR